MWYFFPLSSFFFIQRTQWLHVPSVGALSNIFQTLSLRPGLLRPFFPWVIQKPYFLWLFSFFSPTRVTCERSSCLLEGGLGGGKGLSERQTLSWPVLGGRWIEGINKRGCWYFWDPSANALLSPGEPGRATKDEGEADEGCAKVEEGGVGEVSEVKVGREWAYPVALQAKRGWQDPVKGSVQHGRRGGSGPGWGTKAG